MYEELRARESRLTLKDIAGFAAASAAVYAAVSAFGVVAVVGIGCLTVGYLIRHCTKL